MYIRSIYCIINSAANLRVLAIGNVEKAFPSLIKALSLLFTLIIIIIF